MEENMSPLSREHFISPDRNIVGPHWEEDIELDSLPEDYAALMAALEVDPEEIRKMKGE
jgi:hypothetical protein